MAYNVTTPPRSRPKGGCLPRSYDSREGRGLDRDQDTTSECSTPPTSLMEAVSRASKNTSTRTSTNNDFRHGRVLGHYSRTRDDSDSCATAIARISLERGLASASSSCIEIACAGGKFHV